jgi:hypothetical protein
MTSKLFDKSPIRSDIILPLIEEMMALSSKQDYENADLLLSRIEDLLSESKPELTLLNMDSSRIGNVQTISDIYDLVTSHAIRLNPADYKTHAFLFLLLSLYNRIDELQGASYNDTERHRRVVAEEMVINKIIIATHFKKKSKKPNRRFLEVALKVNPSISKEEIMRREKTKLYGYIKSGNEKEQRDVKKNFVALKENNLD